jgi:hypothetical protein
MTRRLQRDPMRRASALANVVDAALDHADGDGQRARKRLQHCVRAFEEQGLSLYAAAARVRLGQLVGGAIGEQQTRDATQEFTREGIVRPDRMVALLAGDLAC